MREVLWEGGRNDTGLTENYLRVKSNRQQNAERKEGVIEKVRLTGVSPSGLMECRTNADKAMARATAVRLH